MPRLQVGAKKKDAPPPVTPPPNGGVDLLGGLTPSGEDLLGSLTAGVSIDLDAGAGDLLGALKPVTEAQVVAEIQKHGGAASGVPGVTTDLTALVAENVKTRNEILGAIEAMRTSVLQAVTATSEQAVKHHGVVSEALKLFFQKIANIENTMTIIVNSINEGEPEEAPKPAKAEKKAAAAPAEESSTAIDNKLMSVLKQAMTQLQNQAPKGGNVPVVALAQKLQAAVPHLSAEDVLRGMVALRWTINRENLVIPAKS